MIEELEVVLQRYWESINRITGPQFIAHLLRFVTALRSDSRTRGLLDDLARDEQESVDRLSLARSECEAALRSLITEIDRHHPNIIGRGRTLTTEFLPYLDDKYRVRDPYRHVLTQVRSVADAVFERMRKDVNKEIEADRRPNATLKARVDAAHALRDRITSIDAALSHAQRARNLDELASPAAALVQLEREIDEFHPPPGRLPQAEHLNHLRNFYFSGQPALRNERGALEQSQPLRDRAALVFEEIQRRLGLERSLLSLLHRYKQRVEWYEAHRLRALAADGPGHIEDRLTSTLAMFLFDHGLNPLTRPMIGPGQPDLLDSDQRFSFYVEAKQHSRSARSYLVKGLRQVWDMFERVRGTRLEVREAFYVVFHLGGPQYQFPRRLSSQGRVVFPLVVNIAPMTAAGSNAPAAIAIEEAELLPTR